MCQKEGWKDTKLTSQGAATKEHKKTIKTVIVWIVVMFRNDTNVKFLRGLRNRFVHGERGAIAYKEGTSLQCDVRASSGRYIHQDTAIVW